MVNCACAFNQSESRKYFEWIVMLNMLFNTLLKITPHNTQKEEEEKKEQRMDLHDDIRGRSPIQFLTPTDRA